MKIPFVVAVVAVICLSATPASAERCPNDLPVLFIVQDKSGSMNQPPDPATDPNAPTKWATAKLVVPDLASQFANRFRYGVHMYPGQTSQFNCTVGSTLAPVPSTAAQVNTVFQNAVAGGGTPTAVSLDSTRTYLSSLGLTEPAHVLLITDGLPNCNLSLDATTCEATTPGCANNSCGLGSKDCNDEVETRAAASRLLAAGYKVYVVGFGTSVTGGNNKTVLDGIASAGGTGSAYVANDQASLSNVLNQIGYNAATCCKDVCTEGAAMCTADGKVQSCQLDAALGCTTWTTQSCQTRSTCQGGSCVSCTDACTLNAARCVGNSTETCVVGPVGCNVWQTGETCASGFSCNNGNCGSCQPCVEGAKRCNGTGTESCVADPTTGCTHWQTAACTSGTTCNGGTCQSCNNTCTAGVQRCNGNGIEVCEVDAQGCTGWTASATCTNFCNNGRCGACSNPCTIGETRCNGGSVETCAANSNGCGEWGGAVSCGAGSACRAGACVACVPQCDLGAKRCVGDAIEECSVNAEGCTAWRTSGACTTGSTCGGGECRKACGGEEGEICATDETCQQFPEGYFCVPEKRLGDHTAVKGGCGCSSGVDAMAVFGLLGIVAALRRRRPSP